MHSLHETSQRISLNDFYLVTILKDRNNRVFNNAVIDPLNILEKSEAKFLFMAFVEFCPSCIWVS